MATAKVMPNVLNMSLPLQSSRHQCRGLRPSILFDSGPFTKKYTRSRDFHFGCWLRLAICIEPFSKEGTGRSGKRIKTGLEKCLATAIMLSQTLFQGRIGEWRRIQSKQNDKSINSQSGPK